MKLKNHLNIHAVNTDRPVDRQCKTDQGQKEYSYPL